MPTIYVGPTVTLPPDPWRVPTLSISEAAVVLGISRASAYRLAREGRIRTTEILGTARVLTTWLYAELGLEVPLHPSRRQSSPDGDQLVRAWYRGQAYVVTGSHGDEVDLRFDDSLNDDAGSDQSGVPVAWIDAFEMVTL